MDCAEQTITVNGMANPGISLTVPNAVSSGLLPGSLRCTFGDVGIGIGGIVPCSKCGQQSQSSLAAEREREARAKQRREMAETQKKQFADRRAQLIAQVKADREQARRG